MADINLLQGQKESGDNTQLVRVLNKAGLVFLALVIIAYGYLYIDQKRVESQIGKLEAQRVQTQSDITKVSKYDNLLSAQEKINGLEILLDHHLAWSQVINNFSDVTLQGTVYKKFVAKNDGTATIQGTVSNFSNLDKLIQGLNGDPTDKANNIKEVKLTNVSLSSDNGTNSLNFNLSVVFNNGLLTWDKNTNANR